MRNKNQAIISGYLDGRICERAYVNLCVYLCGVLVYSVSIYKVHLNKDTDLGYDSI